MTPQTTIGIIIRRNRITKMNDEIISKTKIINGTIFELDESLSRFAGIDLFPKKTAKEKEILQKAKIPNRIKSNT